MSAMETPADQPSSAPHSGRVGNIFKHHSALVQVEPVARHIAGKIEIRQAVVIDIPHRHAGATGYVFVHELIVLLVAYQKVIEIHPGMVGRKKGEDGLGGCSQLPRGRLGPDGDDLSRNEEQSGRKKTRFHNCFHRGPGNETDFITSTPSELFEDGSNVDIFSEGQIIKVRPLPHA